MMVTLALRRLSLLAVNGALAVSLWREAGAPPSLPEERLSATRSIVAEPAAYAPTPQAASDAATPSRDLFAASEPAPPVDPPPPPPPVVAPAIVLIGTALGEPSFAVVRLSPDAPVTRVKEGATIGDFILASVRKNAIVVLHDQIRWSIGFSPATPVRCSTPACTD